MLMATAASLEEYEPAHMGVEVAAVLLDNLPRDRALQLLRSRLDLVRQHRERTVDELGVFEPGSASDHILLLVDAEIMSLERAIARLDRLTGRSFASATT